MDPPNPLSYCIVRDRETPLDHAVIGRLPDRKLQFYPHLEAQNIWSEETIRQANEEIVDLDKHYMQQYVKGDKPTCFQVEFPFLGFNCHWSNLDCGISQWLCETSSDSNLEKDDHLYEEMTYYKHKVFRRQLVSVPSAVCLYLSKLHRLAPSMDCGCIECDRKAISNTYHITVHVDNNGDDPGPLVGASYLVLFVCDRLLVSEFFRILKGSSKKKPPARSYFRQIVGSTTYPDAYVYGKCYSYDVYKTGDVRMGDLDLDFSCSPGSGKGVLVMMGKA